MLPQEFYSQPADLAARQLLGKILVHETAKGTVSGRIVETEAYLSNGDPGCHAARGKTARNAPMFEMGGVAYVYLIYGLYHCFNVVTGAKGRGEAVLVRAVAPLEGISLMARRRGLRDVLSLCSGPGKLCQAFAIAKDANGSSLRDKPLYILNGQEPENITVTTRIGLTRGSDRLLRYYMTGSPYVSRP